ncbi:hypothetical protein GDO78_022272, partial [Eleutherodactylus coqui]
TRWRSARDQFHKEYTAVPPSGSSGKRKRPYLWYQQMLYLGPTMGTRGSSDNLDTLTEPEQETAGTVVASLPLDEAVPSTSTATALTSEIPTSAVITARRQARSDALSTLQIQVDMQREVLSTLQRQHDARDTCDSFGQHVASLMRAVPGEQHLQAQGLILFILDRAKTPASLAELEAWVDVYRHRLIQGAQTPPPPPQPLQPPRHYQFSGPYMDALKYSIWNCLPTVCPSSATTAACLASL